MPAAVAARAGEALPIELSRLPSPRASPPSGLASTWHPVAPTSMASTLASGCTLFNGLVGLPHRLLQGLVVHTGWSTWLCPEHSANYGASGETQAAPRAEPRSAHGVVAPLVPADRHNDTHLCTFHALSP